MKKSTSDSREDRNCNGTEEREEGAEETETYSSFPSSERLGNHILFSHDLGKFSELERQLEQSSPALARMYVFFS